MSEAIRAGESPAEDLDWALGALLRSYRALVTPVLGNFPHGPRGHQTLREVIRGQQPSQAALASYLGLDRTVMTYLIDDLVDAGLVERHPHPTDRRQRQVVATAQGRQAITNLCELVAEAELTVLRALDAGERELFRRLLAKAACGGGASPAEACEDSTGPVHEAAAPRPHSTLDRQEPRRSRVRRT